MRKNNVPFKLRPQDDPRLPFIANSADIGNHRGQKKSLVPLAVLTFYLIFMGGSDPAGNEQLQTSCDLRHHTDIYEKQNSILFCINAIFAIFV